MTLEPCGIDLDRQWYFKIGDNLGLSDGLQIGERHNIVYDGDVLELLDTDRDSDRTKSDLKLV